MNNLNSTTYGLLAIFFALCVYIVWFFGRVFNYWKERGLDYLEPRIPFGNAIDVFLKQYTLGELISEWYFQIKEKGLKHGGAYCFWKPIYIPVDPEIVKRILISDAEYFPNRGLFVNEENHPVSGHIFNMEKGWRTLRAKMPAVFTSAKLRRMFLIMEKLSEQFSKNLDAYAQSSKAIDIKKETSRFTTDIVTACAFGIDSNTMRDENKEMLSHGRSFFDYQWNIYRIVAILLVSHNVLRKINFRILPKALENYFADLSRNIINYRKESKLKREDLAATLIRLMEDSDQEHDFTGKGIMEPLDFGQFTAHMCVFFSAGFETSSSTQSFAVYELARRPECQTKLRNEINRILEKYDNKVTYDAVMEMKYLENVVDETLRLYPVLPILPRVCASDYKVPGTDFTIEKDTFVIVPLMGIQRDPEYYPNPDDFDPERFSTENKSTRPFVAHVPFGEGPRICIGKRFGLLQTKIGLITMVRNFQISLNKDKTIPSFKFVSNELILRKTGDIWIEIKKITP